MRDRYNTKYYITERRPYRGRGMNRGLKILLSILLAALLVGVIAFGVLLGVVLAGSHDEVKGEPGAMIILGCQVMPGGEPSVLLRDRLDKALGYWEEHPDVTVVVSGAKGENEPVSESECMRDYLVERGVASGQILREDQSFNTVQNLRFSLRTLSEAGVDTSGGVVVVSNAFHLPRVRLLWGRVSTQGQALSTLAAPTSHTPSRLKMYLREPLALVKSFLLDR